MCRIQSDHAPRRRSTLPSCCRTAIDHGNPSALSRRQRPGVQNDRSATVTRPPSSGDLVADVVVAPVQFGELRPGHHLVLLRHQFAILRPLTPIRPVESYRSCSVTRSARPAPITYPTYLSQSARDALAGKDRYHAGVLLAYVDESFSRDWYYMAALHCDGPGGKQHTSLMR